MRVLYRQGPGALWAMRNTHRPAYRAILDRLVAAREAAGLTQTDVARRLGIPQPRVSRIESGERRLDVLELLDLAACYGVELDALLADASPRPGPGPADPSTPSADSP